MGNAHGHPDVRSGLPQLGAHYFSVRVDGREMDRTSFRLLPPHPPQIPGAALGGPGVGQPVGLDLSEHQTPGAPQV